MASFLPWTTRAMLLVMASKSDAKVRRRCCLDRRHGRKGRRRTARLQRRGTLRSRPRDTLLPRRRRRWHQAGSWCRRRISGEILVRDRLPRRLATCGRRCLALVLRVSPPRRPNSVRVRCGLRWPDRSVGADGVAAVHPELDAGSRSASELEELTQLPVVGRHDATGAGARRGVVRGDAVGVSDFIDVVIGHRRSAVACVSGGRLLQGRSATPATSATSSSSRTGRRASAAARAAWTMYCAVAAIEAETGRPLRRAPATIVERTGIMVGRALASVAALCDVRSWCSSGVGGARTFGEPFFDALRRTSSTSAARLPFRAGSRSCRRRSDHGPR